MFLPTLEVAPETFLVRQLDDTVPLNSLVIRGSEPVLVDTAGPATSDAWQERVFELVDPADVRWVVVSHEDPDHSGGLPAVVERCSNATVLATEYGHERLAARVTSIPDERVRVVEPGDVVQAGDRSLVVTRPPIFDSPTTIGVFDTATHVLWGADAFAVVIPEPYDDAAEMDPEGFVESFLWSQRLLSPWYQWLDAGRYGAHLDGLRALDVQVAVGGHGLALHDGQVDHAFDLFTRMAA